MKRIVVILGSMLTVCGALAATNALEKLSIPSMAGEIVVEFSASNNFARAYQVFGTNTSSPGEIMEFDSGSPADLAVNTDISGEIVTGLKFGGFYIDNHFARIVREDGSIITNNPVAVLNGTTQGILRAWTELGRTNGSFRIEKLDIDYGSNKVKQGIREELAKP